MSLPHGTADAVTRQLFPQPDPYTDNPIGWVREKLGEHMWSAQRRLARSVVRNRYTAVHSCHDSGKSYAASRIAAWWIDVHPPGDAFVVTTAPTSHQVDAILWREIGRAHRKGNLPGRITLDSKWRLGPAYGDELVAYGRKPADYDPDAFQGIHQRYVLVVIDEANGVPKTLYDAVDTLVTNANARVLAIGNPDSPTSHFHKVCTDLEQGWNVIHIDGYRTPNFTSERIPEQLRDLLLSVEWVEERKRKWGVGSPLWQSKVRGIFPTLAADSLVQIDWWEKCAKQTLDPEGFHGQRGYDIARFGDDHTMCYSMRGGILRKEWSVHMSDTVETANRIQADLLANPGVPAVVDETGVGAGVVDTLKERDLFVWGFISGKQAVDPRFSNLRSEAYWHLREQFEYGLLDVDPQDEELKSQLTSLKWKLDSKGRIVVEPKDEYMRRMRAGSPDAADSAMMACWEASTYDADEILQHDKIPSITGDLLTVLW